MITKMARIEETGACGENLNFGFWFCKALSFPEFHWLKRLKDGHP